ncbi:short-chain dehydrogenase [Micromonospora endophytica]|uniref:Short-chain dehydrogenase n=1 Tax=Micromonospora endophytica TaxID=515350 RepID=A0A2W2CTX9_9ACTN|nr:short-chain dehydrogenase [Micromonospora endophytica]
MVAPVIGLAFTRRLLADGWRVAGLSRRDSGINVPTYVHHTVDVTAPEYPEVLSKAIDELGRVDLCVYAAGIGEPIDLADLDAQAHTFEVNLMGAVRTVATVVPRMVAAGDGHLIGLSSLADRLVSAEAPGYAGSKAGLSSYLLGLSSALRGQGVSVTTVRFGFVDTKMAKAPVRPLMLPVDRAVEILARCVRTRPALISRPRRLALLTTLAAPFTRPR